MMRKWLLSAAIICASGSAYAQVPVQDNLSALAQAKSLFQDVKGYALQGQQYLTQAQQLQQQIQAYYSFVQAPSLGGAVGLAYQSGLSNDLPINPAGLMSLTSGYSMSLTGLTGKLSALGGLANTSYDQNHVYDCTDNSWACTQQKQRAFGIAGASGLAQAAYQDIRNHMPVVQALRDRAATATTPAERENLTVALQSEQVWHDNMMAQVNAAQMQAKMDEASVQQKDNEQLSHDIHATIEAIP